MAHVPLFWVRSSPKDLAAARVVFRWRGCIGLSGFPRTPTRTTRWRIIFSSSNRFSHRSEVIVVTPVTLLLGSPRVLVTPRATGSEIDQATIGIECVAL